METVERVIMEENHVLCVFERDWADEFSVYGARIYTQAAWNKLGEELDRQKDERITCYFGTNEGWESEPISEFTHAIKTTVITSKTRALLATLFPRIDGDYGWGWFPDWQDIFDEIQGDKEEEENRLWRERALEKD